MIFYSNNTKPNLVEPKIFNYYNKKNKLLINNNNNNNFNNLKFYLLNIWNFIKSNYGFFIFFLLIFILLYVRYIEVNKKKYKIKLLLNNKSFDDNDDDNDDN